MARKKKQPTDPPPENVDNTDDTFGLPEVEYQPLKRDEPEKVEERAADLVSEEPVIKPDEAPEVVIIEEAPEVVIINEAPEVTPESLPLEPASFPFKDEVVHEEAATDNVFDKRHTYDDDHQPYQPSYSYQKESPELWPKVLGVVLLVALAGLAYWYLAIFRPEQTAREEREKRELLAIQEEARRKVEREQAAARAAEDERQKAAAQVAATPAVGAIETLSGRSSRYYVVVASSIDGDLIMDYAKKLSAKGVSTKIIPPFRRSKFHRLAVAEGDAYETTQTTANGMKGGDYGDKIWVIKY